MMSDDLVDLKPEVGRDEAPTLNRCTASLSPWEDPAPSGNESIESLSGLSDLSAISNLARASDTGDRERAGVVEGEQSEPEGRRSFSDENEDKRFSMVKVGIARRENSLGGREQNGRGLGVGSSRGLGRIPG